jgi:glucose/arabinose dehydrogenase
MRALPFLAPLILLPLVFACSGDDDDAAPATQAPTSAATVGAGASPQPGQTPAAGSSPSGSAGGALPSVKLEPVFPDLAFEGMTGMYAMEDGSWLVTEQPGRVQRILPSGDAELFMDLTDRVHSGSEEGLLGLALTPDYASSGAFYLYYSAPDPRRGVLARFQTLPDGKGDLDSEQVILEVPEPFANHNGGQIVFGPDGYLYLGLGDGGSARDPDGNGQNLDTLLGSILRIDVSGGDAAYSVPSDNPFVGQGSARGEIWAYGLRNPWRFSFDAATGDLWVGDVGQNTREEVDLVVKGGNYGWNVMEGSGCLDGGNNCDQDGLLLPVIDYANGGGNCAVTGGFVYRGAAIPALQGAYLYSDYCGGEIWALRYDGSQVTDQARIADSGFRVSSFAQGNDLEVYVLEIAQAGGIYKLVP